MLILRISHVNSLFGLKVEIFSCLTMGQRVTDASEIPNQVRIKDIQQRQVYCYGSQEEAEGQARLLMVCPVPRPSFVYTISESILEGYAQYGTLPLIR